MRHKGAGQEILCHVPDSFGKPTKTDHTTAAARVHKNDADYSLFSLEALSAGDQLPLRV